MAFKKEYEQRDNSGTLYINRKKKAGSKQPDRDGSAIIDGTEYWIAGWDKVSANGELISLSFETKEAAEARRNQRSASAAPPTSRPPATREELDEEIPF
jgi:hypothetical protein